MKKRSIPTITILLTVLSGCAHYTARQGIASITLESEPTTVTYEAKTKPRPTQADLNAREAVIQEKDAELQTKDETIRQKDDELKQKDADIEERERVIAGKDDTIQEKDQAIAGREEEIARLKAQIAELESANQDLEEQNKNQSQTLAMNQTMISDLSGQVVGLQSKVNVEKKKQQDIKDQEEAKAKALVTLEPLETLVYPKVYQASEPIVTAKNQAVTVAMLPLGETAWSDSQIKEILGSVEDLKPQIIMATGSKENCYKLTVQSGRSALLTEEGVVLTDYPVDGEPQRESAGFRLDENRTLTLALCNLPQLDVLSTMKDGGAWKDLAARHDADRKVALEATLSQLPGDKPVLLGASLYEPATSDWERITPYRWRDSSYKWTLADDVLSNGLNDTYRQTHYTVESDAGNTLSMGSLSERTDYLFSKHVVPLTSSTIAIGPPTTGTNGISRQGLVATYLVP